MRLLTLPLLTGLLLITAGCSSNKDKSSIEKPNIVYIMADDLGIGDLGVYGQEIISTPNIDKLASEGMLFSNFYAGSTVCAPSRAALLTGQHTGTTHVRGNGEFPLAPSKKILPELLKPKGYTNAMFGKWGLGLAGSSGAPQIRDWDEFLGHLHHIDGHYQKPDSLDALQDGALTRVPLEGDAYGNEVFTQAAVDFIAQQPKDNPFFLYLSFTIPHAELIVPDEYLNRHLDEHGNSKYAPETAHPDGRHYAGQAFPKAAYAGLVESLDAYVGELVEALKENAMEDNTIVIFTSDNGTHTEGGRSMEDVDFFQSSGIYKGVKRDLYSGGIKTPFIVKWPERITPGTQSDHIGAFWDVYPTFADITNTSVAGESIDGISFLPTLIGDTDQQTHEYLYWEFHEFGGKQALLKDQWKIIRLEVNENPDAPVALYNLEQDPSEMHNLADELPQKAEELRALMDGVRSDNENFNFGK